MERYEIQTRQKGAWQRHIGIKPGYGEAALRNWETFRKVHRCAGRLVAINECTGKLTILQKKPRTTERWQS